MSKIEGMHIFDAASVDFIRGADGPARVAGHVVSCHLREDAARASKNIDRPRVVLKTNNCQSLQEPDVAIRRGRLSAHRTVHWTVHGRGGVAAR